MKNVLGTNLTLTLYGESHGAAVGAVLDGLAPGLPVEEDYIRAQLSLRRPVGDISTPRQEPDRFVIDSGVYRGKTTGTPLSIRIPNENVRSGDYSAMEHIARPGHADYTGYVKYRGCSDPRGGGHFSGRVTAALVAAEMMTALTMMPTSISSSAISMEAPLWLFSFLRIACIFGTCLFVDLRFNGLAACCGIFPNGVESEFGLILLRHRIYDVPDQACICIISRCT